MTSTTVEMGTISTRIPSRLDRLPWSRFHWRVIVGLGTVWILDGLEVTMVGSVASRMTESGTGIHISPGQIGIAAAVYIIGACLGALFFGQLTDRLGRRKLFILTLAVYITATVATAFSFAPWYFYLARFFTGSGIGGEYAAINSAIDELIPARARGTVDLLINGTYWLGAAGGSALALFFLNEAIFPKFFGWRIGFAFGAILGLTIMLVRRHVPESPRWLFIHGREEEAERIVSDVEHEVTEETGATLDEPGESITVRQRTAIPFRMIGHTAFKLYPRRAVLGLALFVGQAFIYNAFTFNLGGLLGTFYHVSSSMVPIFLIIWALGNFAGPVTLGRLFDTVGRKPMIAGTYIGSTIVTIPLIVFFALGGLGAWGFLGFLLGIFFLASSGASAAYLTVSEIFPMETRALAIAFFYAIGTAVGGVAGPLLFGQMVASGDRGFMTVGLIIGAAVMAIGGIAEVFLGVKAERANLENIAKPLTAQEAESTQEPQRTGTHDGHHVEAQHRREEAERMRARAAEHRATVLELRLDAEGGDGAANDRVRSEETLAQVADLRARQLDEQASASEERRTGDQAEGEHSATAAYSHAKAADLRARSLSEQEQALTVERDADAERHVCLAEAASESARAAEQRALSAERRAGADQEAGARRDVSLARAALHDAWSGMHDARARMSQARAENADETADAAEREADAAEQRALAAEQRVASTEHLATADDVRAERESAEEAEAERAEAAERQQQIEQIEQRISDRVSRRAHREESGLRRLRPGPGSLLQTGRSGGLEPRSEAAAEHALDHEVDAIGRALDEQGAIDRQQLAQLVGARYWGPGRFAPALDAAVEEGRARRLSRRTYGPPEESP